MATITQSEVAPLHQQLHVTIKKEDYLPAFEKALKEHSKKANIPGFRKGMVPAGLVKKMYGSSLFVDEVLRQVDQQVNQYLTSSKVDIFANPIPVQMDLQQIDMNKPADYEFVFEMGLKPAIQLPDLKSTAVKRYTITVDDAMVNEEVERMQQRYGNMTEPEAVESDENVLNLTFTETDAAGNAIAGGIRKDNSVLVRYFKESFRPNLMGKKKGDTLHIAFDEAFGAPEAEWILSDLGIDSGKDRFFNLEITKVGFIEKRELNAEFFAQLFPNDNITTEEEFRARVKTELEGQWATESRNQLHHSLYHVLLDNTRVDFPQEFLKRWLKTQGENNTPKTDEQVEAEFPQFLNQLKWSLITDKIATDASIEVKPEDLRAFSKQQLLGYMGVNAIDEEAEWVTTYIDRMMKDRKYVEDAWNRIQTEKIFQWIESNSNAQDTPISREDFVKMNQEHNHAHH
ncbi:trigger factor [Flaviaesturariibacter flavus]|uniref:Trigger factor n=1 Tax=Flaviaesturariibacter flavus TaxID=2502780 RepID=A0A4R1BBI7_9BACT|nr:trigger factor [Flaviaesturariibacter flavus]TCJ14359.1 trigger factor [Flaviaesturariibacter flavus]